MRLAIQDDDRRRVDAAIGEAELRTRAEIVPVIAGSSGRYDRAEDVIGLWCAVLALIVTWLLVPLPHVEAGGWSGPSPVWQLVALVVATLVGFVVGAVAGTHIDTLRRLFTPRVQMRDEVFARARAVFFDQRVHHTQDGCGVLLYVSLFEHMAAVIADQAVTEKLGQSAIDSICVEFTGRLRDGDPITAICETANSLGTQLAAVIPRPTGNVNELSDALVVLP